MFPERSVAPALLLVSVRLLFSVMFPLKVRFALPPIVRLAFIATLLATAFAPLKSAEELRVPPRIVNEPVPSDVLLPIRSVPPLALRVVPPWKFAPEKSASLTRT